MKNTHKMHISFVRGAVGGNNNIKIGEKYVGHFYIDASKDIDGRYILDQMINAWNEKHSASFASLKAPDKDPLGLWDLILEAKRKSDEI